MANNIGYQPVRTKVEDDADLSRVVVSDESKAVARGRKITSMISVDSSADPEVVQARLDRRQQRLNTQLLDAVIKGDLNCVRRALEEGADVNTRCRDSGISACHIAAYFGYPSILQFLLSCEAVLKSDFKGHYAIHLAAWSGHDSILAILANHGLDIKVIASSTTKPETCILDSWDHDHHNLNESIPSLQKGATPLHIASQRAHSHCVEFLIRSGASLSAWDDRNLSPLDVAGELSEDLRETRSSRLADNRVALFDDEDDDVLNNADDDEIRERENDEPRLLRASFNFMGARSVAFSNDVDEVDSNAADVRSELSDSSTTEASPAAAPVIGTRGRVSSEARSHDMLQNILNLFILGGAQLDGVGDDSVTSLKSKKMTPLHTAVLKGNLGVVRVLLENDFDTTILNEDGLAPIHLAVQTQNSETLRALLDGESKRQACMNLKNARGQTPLHMAVLQEWESGVSLLLESGADLLVADAHFSCTVLHMAAQKGNSKILNELLTIPEVKYIIDARNRTEHTPLMIAVIGGCEDCVGALLKHGADISATLPSNVSVAHLATQQGLSSILELLLTHDPLKSKDLANLKETLTGTTPLHKAALRGYTECIRCLLRNDADVYIKAAVAPHFGGNALHLATRKGHANVVKVLLEHDKSLVNSVNADKWYPLHIAARFGHRNCVREIILKGGNLADSVKDLEGTNRTAIDIVLWCLPQPVKFIRQLLDSAIQVNGFPLNHAKCQVKLSYDILFPDSSDVDAMKGRQMKVLAGILNTGHKQLQETSLPHPLVETFLQSKWKKLCGIFAFLVLINSLFTVSLTARALLLYRFQSPDAGAWFVALTDAVCQGFLFLTLPVIILKELLHASLQPKYYWVGFESWLKWSVLVLTLYSVASADLGFGHEQIQKHATSFAVLLSWIYLLVLLSRLPSWGLHVLMFFSVARNFIQVFCAFSILLLGFTFAFLIQFEGSEPFADFWEALMKVLVMTSEFDYGSMFTDNTKADPIAARILFVLFIVLVAVVLMNLLVGLAVSDIAVLEAQGKSERLGKQVDFMSLIEGFVYNDAVHRFVPTRITKWIRKKISVPRSLKMYPGRPLDHTLPGHLKDSLLETLRSSVASRKSSVNEASSTKSYDSESDLGDGSEDEDVKELLTELMSELRDMRKEIEILKK